MDTPILEAIAVEKIHPKKSTPALTGVNLALHPGELVAVIGHNGAGKSTLFDILGGLMKPTRGTVTNSVAASAIGWCPQREIIDWSLTVAQNILVGLDLRGNRWHRRAEIESIAAVLAFRVSLTAPRKPFPAGNYAAPKSPARLSVTLAS